MKEIAPGLFLLSGFPPAAFNVYLIRSGQETVLVDTSTRHARRRILRQLPDGLDAIFVTHAHRDHAGSMHAVAETTGAPVWAGEQDADALEGKVPEPMPAGHENHPMNRLFSGWWRDKHPVARRLREGEQVAGFDVVAFPGHTPGQIGLWRASDRTAVCGDVFRTVNVYTGIPQVGEMPEIFTCDREEARRSIHKLAALEPQTVCVGHGRPLTGSKTAKLKELANRL